MKIQIKSRFTGGALFESDKDSLKLSVEFAVEQKANLYGADLCGANLRGANLRGADLCAADLRGANLCAADLCGANLRGADLCGANLRGADLCGAVLRGADLRGANLRGANLYAANLYAADLCGAKITKTAICDGVYHHITNIGSEVGTLELYSCGDYGWHVKRGCFSGSKQEFLDAVNEAHGDSEHGKKYRAIIEVFCS